MKKERIIFDNPVPRKIIGLLLKEEMSPSDLAEKIYRKKNARSGISKWLKRFEENGWIERVDKSKRTGRKKLYKAKIEVLGDFDKRENDFVKLCIERFWNPLHGDLTESLTDLLLELLVIKKMCKLKGKISGYNPKKDLEFYKENKGQFWGDPIFRNKLLNKIEDSGRGKMHVTGEMRLREDFIFVSLFAPDSLFNKIKGKHNQKTNPLFVVFNLLTN